MSSTHVLIIDGKQAEYRIEPTKKKNIVRFSCPAARIDQQFEAEDVPALLIDLPELVREEWLHDSRRTTTLRFRTTTAESNIIEQRAKAAGKSVSEYLRERALV